MDKQNAKLPLIKGFQLNTHMFVSPTCVKTHQDFLRDLSRLVVALKKESPQNYLVNLCEDRYFFTLTFCAGLTCSMTNLLPQNRQPETLRMLSETYDHLIVMADDRVVELLQTIDAVDMALPLIPEMHLAAIAFTSGSTGTPQPNKKYWKTLCGTAEKLVQRLLQDISEPPIIVATVPSQHMFGMEMTMMMALQGACVVNIDKPFFPSDIVDAISALPDRTVLVTTPVHLRVLIASGLQSPKLAKIVSATAPLSFAAAQDVEEKMQTVLEEIYGCTEAGATATRRSAKDERWYLLDGMKILQQGDGFFIQGEHLPETAYLQDLFELQSDNYFRLLGRTGDMINVGGKRASIENMNQLLLAIDGVDDGIVYLPDNVSKNGLPRPAAFVVTSLSEQDIFKFLEKSLDPVFLPRPLIKVKMIHRNETGKVSREQLQKMQRDFYV